MEAGGRRELHRGPYATDTVRQASFGQGQHPVRCHATTLLAFGFPHSRFLTLALKHFSNRWRQISHQSGRILYDRTFDAECQVVRLRGLMVQQARAAAKQTREASSAHCGLVQVSARKKI